MLNGKIIPVYNDEILAEYTEVLHRSKFCLTEESINLLIAYIQKYGLYANRFPYVGNMSDEKDRPFYEVALNVDDSFLVTGNIKHFPFSPKVVSPAEIISILRNSNNCHEIQSLP